STKAAGSVIRASYGILAEDTTVQALARENDPSQIAGTDAFKNKGFGALVQVARESQELFETITADPDNFDRFLEVLAHMVVAAKDEQESSNQHDGHHVLEVAGTGCPHLVATRQEPIITVGVGLSVL